MKRVFLLPLLASLLLTMEQAHACSRPPLYKEPSLEENYKSAQFVFYGLITKKTEFAPQNASIKHEFEVGIEKAWKGKPPKKLKLSAFSNTCDPFGQMVEEKSFCILFVSSESGILSKGESSKCVSPADAKSLIADFEKKLQKIKASPSP